MQQAEEKAQIPVAQPQLPKYPHAVPVLDKSRAKPLIKMIAARFMARAPKGIAASQQIKIGHKKKDKEQPKVKYW